MLVENKNQNNQKNQVSDEKRQKKNQESANAGSYSARRKTPKSAIEGLGKKAATTAAKGVANSIAPGMGDKVVDHLAKKRQMKNRSNSNLAKSNLNSNPKDNSSAPISKNPFQNLGVMPKLPQMGLKQKGQASSPAKSPLNDGSTHSELEEDGINDEVLDEEIEESSGFFHRKGKNKQRSEINGVFSDELKAMLKKSAPIWIPIVSLGVLFLLLSMFILMNINDFGPMLGINTKVGGETGGEEYEAMDAEEDAFYDRVKVIHDEYVEDGASFDAELIGAVFFIMQTYNEELTFEDMNDAAIRKIVEAMFDTSETEDGVIKTYNKDTFIDNLVNDVFPDFLSNIPKEQYHDIAEEAFDYIDDYKDFIEANQKKDNGVCIEGTLQATQLAQLSPQTFVDTLGPIAQRDYSRTGVFASVTIAQAILESNWGKSGLSLQYNNMFGIKCSRGWTGQCAVMGTHEEEGGNLVARDDAFRVYNSVDESLYDHSQFLIKNPRYAANGTFSAKNGREQIAAIKRAGYATDSHYVSKITNLMDKYGLEKWDVTVNTNTSGDDCLGASSGGWDIRTVAPTSADFAFNLKNSNRGQCVWYAQGRAIEVARDLASKGLITQKQANNIQNILLMIFGNAGIWYEKAVGSGFFNGSRNIKDLKAGSILVWSQPRSYGHIAFVENVDTTNNTVTITEGWATNTASCPNSWNCVNFKSNVMSIDDYYNSFGPYYTGRYRFVGYIYALEPKVG